MKVGNTLKRIIVAFIAIPAILGIILYGKWVFLLFATAIGIYGFKEFYAMSVNKKFFPQLTAGMLSTSAIILNSYLKVLPEMHLFMIIIPVMLFIELFRNKHSAVSNLGTTLLGIAYTGILVSSLVYIREFYAESGLMYSKGALIIIAMFVSVWVCDSAAFFIGSAFGKNKLFPRVSPKKSWEGAFAGLAGAVIAMIACRAIFLDYFSIADAAFLGVIIGIFGQAGDLAESLIKRDCNVKDSSNLIPGHGGVLDRFDSIIFLAPFVYLYLEYVIK